MNAAVLRYDRQSRQGGIVLQSIFAEAGLRRELSRTKASAIREAPPCRWGASLYQDG